MLAWLGGLFLAPCGWVHSDTLILGLAIIRLAMTSIFFLLKNIEYTYLWMCQATWITELCISGLILLHSIISYTTILSNSYSLNTTRLTNESCFKVTSCCTPRLEYNYNIFNWMMIYFSYSSLLLIRFPVLISYNS